MLFDQKTIENFYLFVEKAYKDALEIDLLNVYDGNEDNTEDDEWYCIDVTCDEKIFKWQIGEFWSKLYFSPDNTVSIHIVLDGICINDATVNKIIKNYENTELSNTWTIDEAYDEELINISVDISYNDFGELYSNIKNTLNKLFDPTFVSTILEINKYLDF